MDEPRGPIPRPQAEDVGDGPARQRPQADGELEAAHSLRVGFEAARLRLAQSSLDAGKTCAEAARRVAEICATTLEVERVGVWVFDPPHDKLTCLHSYSRSTGQVAPGETLLAADFPTYCRALTERRAIVAHDACSHPLTRELTERYLRPKGITSMLDAPVFRAGQLFAVVCHEHVGPPRTWTQAEVDFAGSVADVIAMVFEQRARLDLEDQLRAQAGRLQELERLEQLRRIVAAVAHDFSSILGAVLLETSRLEKVAPASAANLADCVAVGNQLLSELRTFAEPGERPRQAELGPTLDALRRPIQMLVRDRADLSMEIADPATRVALRPAELEQIVLNLCLNGHEAMSKPGRIAVRAWRKDDMAVIEIADDGAGVPEELRSRIFDPYFTTKPMGSGLGLATVRRIVDEIGGRIELESKPGAGTRFRVALPLAR